MSADKMADALVYGWRRYMELFRDKPHGTKKQMLALLELSGLPNAREPHRDTPKEMPK